MKALLNKAIALSVICVLPLSASLAIEKPEHSRLDGRIQYTDYRPGQVYPVNAVNGIISSIVFAPDEKVLDYGSGYSTAWEFQARANHFFLKPKAFNGTTNVIVVTDKHTYHFDVRLIGKKSNATYSLVFRYPIEAAQKAKAEAEKKVVDGLMSSEVNPEESEKADAEKRINRLYTENFGSSALSKEIAPLQVFDDGMFTYLKFDRQTDFPSVYRVAEDDEETLLNSHVKGDWLVIHGVFKELRLRAGKAVVGIYNEAYTGGGVRSESGVSVPGVQREIIREVN